MLLTGTFWEVKGKPAIQNTQRCISYLPLPVCVEGNSSRLMFKCKQISSLAGPKVKADSPVFQRGQVVTPTVSTNKISCCHDTNKPCSSCIKAHCTLNFLLSDISHYLFAAATTQWEFCTEANADVFLEQIAF